MKNTKKTSRDDFLLKENMTDRQKVSLWLDKIQEHDAATRAEVLDICTNDKEARFYFVDQYNAICK